MRITLTLLLLFPTLACAEDWSRWRGPDGQGVWHAPALSFDAPQRAWTQPIGGGYAGVTVVDDLVYTMDRDGDGERILCFDAETGEPRWAHRYAADYGDLTYDSGPRASVTVHDGRAYALGAVGHVHCLDAATGDVHWSIDTMNALGAQQPKWGFAASPLIVGEHVILHIGAQPNGCIVALDRITGKEAWRGGDDPAGYCTPKLIEHDGEPQLIVWNPDHVVGHDPRDGAVQWKIPYDVRYGVSIADPLYHDGLVLVAGYWHGSKAIRLGVKARSATLAWEDDMLRGLMSAPLKRGEFVYLLDRTFGVTCVRIADGEKLWQDKKHTITPGGRNPQVSLVWLTGQPDPHAAAGLNADGELLLLSFSPEGFDIRARVAVIDPTWAHPAYAGNRVYARSNTQLVCVTLPAATTTRDR